MRMCKSTQLQMHKHSKPLKEIEPNPFLLMYLDLLYTPRLSQDESVLSNPQHSLPEDKTPGSMSEGDDTTRSLATSIHETRVKHFDGLADSADERFS